MKRKHLGIKAVDEIKEQDYVIPRKFWCRNIFRFRKYRRTRLLKIKYADEDKLYVPVDSINKIEKVL